ncbi:hypothetical protein DUI87_19101 [Hirundo rustica rustica]|uniref:RNase H type-1 domain-containing protein n=1 Tax=Hirundo rustica rustica TaxID=333673 RepID=A0A3M0JTF8_HIRRU|nr:hypothetical protein DUI87_19101 [Hirundo rustica rustica]
MPLENPDWELFIDGSSFMRNGRWITGYAVTTQDKVIEEKALSANVSSQKAELIALMRALDLSKGKKALAELCDAVRKYGLGSAKVMQVLCYFNASLLTPFDIWSLAQTLYPPVEYDFLVYKWTQLAVRAVERNATLDPGNPRCVINTDMLLGTGNYTRADGQVGFEPLVQEQCQQTGMAALVQTIQLATPQESFAMVVQGVDKPFLRFAGQLTCG